MKYNNLLFLTFLILLYTVSTSWAVDTDAYQVNSQQNTYLVLDTSGSMQYGVYEHSVDYADVFNSMRVDSEVSAPSSTLTYDRYEIYLIRGNVKMVLSNDEPVTGDAGAVPMSYADGISWDFNTITSTHTSIETYSITSIAEEGETARLTINNDSKILFDGVALPYDLSLVEHKYMTLYDNSTIDKGFAGMLQAPGYYFSGYEAVGSNIYGHDRADDGDSNLYFFVTGNWLNYQKVCDLDYKSGMAPRNGPHNTYTRPWQNKTVTIGTTWFERPEFRDYPSGSSNYVKNTNENTSRIIITEGNATSIKVHFSMFDVNRWGDYVKIYQNGSNQPIATYDNAHRPPDGWSVIAQGDTIEITLKSDSDWYTGKGYTIDKIAYTTDSGTQYKIQSRLDVATDSINYVLEEFSKDINWGYAYFDEGDGVDFHTKLNPTLSDINRQNIQADVKNAEAYGGTPLGEALQDIFQIGYYTNNGLKNAGLRKQPCSKNYAIMLSDGFPSSDEDWNRISGVTFSDWDGDDYTYDPSQSTTKDYYDDVAHWMYTHSWIDMSVVADPRDSYNNIITHHIAFATENALLEDAAGESGGTYLVAYNKSQLMHALYSVAQMIGHAVSFTAPAVSVDAENKIQNGDELYMGLFLPMNERYWVGNLKKYQFGDGSIDRPEIWGIYDASNSLAADLETGEYFDDTDGFWGDESDSNDSDNRSEADITEDGVGEVLTESVLDSFTSGTYYQRAIRIADPNDDNGYPVALVDFAANATNDNLTVASDEARYSTVNWAYGYTFAANEDGDPVAVREWALGPIIHSRPTIVDYYNNEDSTVVDHRYIIVGACDGMLHVFDDFTGEELMAFIPNDAMVQLKNFETLFHQPLVDGEIKLVRDKADDDTISQPKYLIFGQRRGGGSIIALDISDPTPTNWTIAWEFSDAEMTQSWSSIEVAKICTGTTVVTEGETSTSTPAYTEVAIFTGGYDPGEDNYPEPFADADNDGIVDTNEWRSSNSDQDVNGNGEYDTHNTSGDSAGRAVFVVNVATGDLIFSMKHCAADGTEVVEGSEQTTKKFKYCFPADPSVVTGYVDNEMNVLRALYITDIYGNIFRFNYSYNNDSGTWTMYHLFSANPASLSGSGTTGAGLEVADEHTPWRKVFYAPSISWRGSGNYFDPSNYHYADDTYSDGISFDGIGNIASLFFGTGDREHPAYNIVSDRVYAIYDDSIVTAEYDGTPKQVTSAPYTEDDLLNLTCDELGIDTTQTSMTEAQTATYKTGLYTLLTDDVLDQTVSPANFEGRAAPVSEDDAKGWYIVLDKQATSTYCYHCTYKATIDNATISDDDNHFGEKIFSRLTLYAGVLYFTAYQPNFDDPCVPEGNGLTYAINYLNAGAALNLNTSNDSKEDPLDPASPVVEQKDITDRYKKEVGIKELPSALTPVFRNGEVFVPGVGVLEDRERPIDYWLEK